MDITSVQHQRAIPTIGTKEGDKALREKTDQFEAIIVKMMLDEAMKDEKMFLPALTIRETRFLNRCIVKSFPMRVQEDLGFLKCFSNTLVKRVKKQRNRLK